MIMFISARPVPNRVLSKCVFEGSALSENCQFPSQKIRPKSRVLDSGYYDIRVHLHTLDCGSMLQ